MLNEIDNSQDIIDLRDIISRDIISRVEELRDEDTRDEDEEAELKTLTALLEDCKGNGGDEQWEGDWYPVTLIRDSYFTTYAQELLQDCGDLPATIPHYVEIDWEATARNIRVDYTSTEFDGVTYWYR